MELTASEEGRTLGFASKSEDFVSNISEESTDYIHSVKHLVSHLHLLCTSLIRLFRTRLIQTST